MIVIRPLIGVRRGVEADTGIDEVMLVDSIYPAGRRIALVARSSDAPLQLVEHGISEAVVAEAKRALSQRDGSSVERTHHEAPLEIEAADDDGEH